VVKKLNKWVILRHFTLLCRWPWCFRSYVPWKDHLVLHSSAIKADSNLNFTVRSNGRVRTTLKAAAKTEAKKRLLKEDIQAEMSIA
jgi:hypothetical protein